MAVILGSKCKLRVVYPIVALSMQMCAKFDYYDLEVLAFCWFCVFRIVALSMQMCAKFDYYDLEVLEFCWFRVPDRRIIHVNVLSDYFDLKVLRISLVWHYLLKCIR